MKPIKQSLLLLSMIFTFGAHSQDGLYLLGILNNSPGYEVDIAVTVFSDANPPVNVTAVADETGEFGGPWFWIDAPGWTHFRTIHETCTATLDTTWFYADSLQFTADIFITIDYCESAEISGCTDPIANNFNPNATIDDGSCIFQEPGCVDVNLDIYCVDTLSAAYDSTITQDSFCCLTSWDGICQDLYIDLGGQPLPECAEADSCATNEALIIVNTGTWGQEISWTLLHNGVTVLSQGNYADIDDMDYYYELCLEDGCYTLEMFDLFGDGWNGGGFQLLVDNQVIASGGITSGEYGMVEFGINESGCEQQDISGCTDPTAINYDPNATVDDGSCEYQTATNDLCADATALIQGTQLINNIGAVNNENIWGDCWAFGSGEGEQSSIWFSFTTPDTPASIHIEASPDGTNTLTDTQFGLFESCGGEMIYCDGNAGQGLFSAFDFACGELEENTEYILMIDGYFGDSGTCFLTFEVDTLCAEVPGCTDPDAYNYNPSATSDDGSCEYITSCESNIVMVEIFTQNWGDEISWNLLQNDSVVASGGNYNSNSYYGTWICLEDGCYTFEMFDSYGDGWNGATFNVMDPDQNVYASGDLPSGYSGTVNFGINTECDSTDVIPGCTDPDALNYNPLATTDDGSCEYIPSCESNIVKVEISTQSWGTEVSWNLLQNDSIIASGGDYFSYSDLNVTWLCLDDGCYTFEMFDSFGDGWNGATFTIMDTDANIYTSGTLSTGSYGTQEFGINADCESTGVVFGCTNPDAINYNPNATDDDGSCEYEFECSINFTVSPDTTGAQVMWITPSENIFNAAWVEWDFGDGNTSSDLFPIHTYAGDGPYTLCLTAYFEEANGGFCEITYCAVLTDEMIDPPGMQSSGFSINVLDPLGETSAIAEEDALSNISVWPNPATSHAQLEFSLSASASIQIEVIDVTGKIVKSEPFSGVSGSNLHQLDLSMLKPGMYFVNLTGNNLRKTSRLVKQ